MMMKNVAIATDSHSSITPEMAQTLGVAVLPMPFTIDGTCYLEEETLTRAEFYAHQRRGAKIATSQPAPTDVTALWDNLLTDHDEVVYIPISSGLSGSCQAAMALAADAPYAGRVFVVDNGRVATALHVTVLDALRLRDAGDDAATIKRKLEAVREDMCIYVAVETLEHLKRGGRISTATALIGTLLHIKPILHFTTGTLSAYKKARGMNRAQDVMIEAIRAELAGRFAEPLAQGRVTLLAASSASPEATAAWEARLQAGVSGTAAAV
ncbi:MAG: DegV family protein [Christensenellales bacterium]